MFKIDNKDENLYAGKIIGNKSAQSTMIIFFIITAILGALIDWGGAIFLGAAIAVMILSLNSAVIIPTVYFGIPTRFKERIRDNNGKVIPIEEGLHFMLPMVSDLLPENLRSRKLVTHEVKTSALSEDKLEITIEGSVQYKPENLNTYIEMEIETITNGMIDAIESEVGRVCGTKKADTFIAHREQIEKLIQCALQLDRAPHNYINIVGNKEQADNKLDETRDSAQKIRALAQKKDGESDDDFKKFIESSRSLKEVIAKGGKKRFIMGIVLKELLCDESFKSFKDKIKDEAKLRDYIDKLSPEKWNIQIEEGKNEVNRIAFYKDNLDRITLLFEIENKLDSRRSPVEKLYGVKVETFRLSKLKFSDSAQKAFEEKRGATAKMDAADTRLKKKIEMLEAFIKAGLSPTEAVNMVETTAGVDGINRQIVSVEGSQSSDLLAFAKVLAGNKGGGKP